MSCTNMFYDKAGMHYLALVGVLSGDSTCVVPGDHLVNSVTCDVLQVVLVAF